MIDLHDRFTIAHALTIDLHPRLRELLAERIAALDTEYGDLTDWTEFLVIEPDDTEAAIVEAVGFSPLVDPISGARYGDPTFQPGWDYLADRCGWFEMVVAFGSTHAVIALIEDGSTALAAMCRNFAIGDVRRASDVKD